MMQEEVPLEACRWRGSVTPRPSTWSPQVNIRHKWNFAISKHSFAKLGHR